MWTSEARARGIINSTKKVTKTCADCGREFVTSVNRASVSHRCKACNKSIGATSGIPGGGTRARSIESRKK